MIQQYTNTWRGEESLWLRRSCVKRHEQSGANLKMTIDFSCPKCGAPIHAPDGSEGRNGTCINCNAKLIVPKRDELDEQTKIADPPTPEPSSSAMAPAPSIEMATQYYLRVRGKVMGPFGPDRLVTLREQGLIERDHEISPDRTSWQPAGTFGDLFPSVQSDVEGDGPTYELSRGSNDAVTLASNLPASVIAHLDEFSDAWFYDASGEPKGPVAFRVLEQMVMSGELSADDMVWRKGLDEWKPAGEVKELFPSVGGTSVESVRSTTIRKPPGRRNASASDAAAEYLGALNEARRQPAPVPGHPPYLTVLLLQVFSVLWGGGGIIGSLWILSKANEVRSTIGSGTGVGQYESVTALSLFFVSATISVALWGLAELLARSTWSDRSRS